MSAVASWSPLRAGRLLAVFAAAAAALALMQPNAVDAESGLLFPAPAGTEWEVIAGYNTVTHEGVDPYALDLARTDRSKTGGTALLAPISGTIGYTSDTCVSVRNSEINILMCHVFAEDGLRRGQSILAGERLGTVAPDGQAENNGIAHIHLQVNRRVEGRGGSSGEPVALSGEYALDGVSFPATTQSNAHYLKRVTSTNSASLGLTAVDAGADRLVDRGSSVTLTATSPNATEFSWQQLEGAAVTLSPSGASVTFQAPEEAGTLRFQVTANGPRGLATDTVRVQIRSTVPIAGEGRGRILAGEVPSAGVGLIYFGGGSNDELVEATSCEVDLVRFFATSEGRFIGFIPAAQVPIVNAEWNALFPEGLSETPLIVRCG